MSEATKQPNDARGFNSRWILPDGATDAAAPVAGDASASARHIDSDGDGIADTLAVRVDTTAARPGAMHRLGAWMGRSITLLVVIAALVVAGAAATSLYHTRQDLADTQATLDQQEALLLAARDDAETARDEVTKLQREQGDATVELATVTAERDELALEARVLRRMLLEAERRADA